MSWVCGSSLAEIAGSNSAGGIDVSLLRVLCFVRARGILSSVMCLSWIAEPHIGGLGPIELSSHGKNIYMYVYIYIYIYIYVIKNHITLEYYCS